MAPVGCARTLSQICSAGIKKKASTATTATRIFIFTILLSWLWMPQRCKVAILAFC
ncbi:hypothetical protein BDZ45DRAFT_673847 [Acephala macrosclerotiorum]|nr:hypothetical protein BDZ45DRAFT_673847 [Acephala macrosclerotiorum]